MRYRPELDGLRAFAVFAVIASHAPERAFSGGWMGVDVFFVLSGYLITTLLLAEHDRVGRISLRRFYSRRVLRLYPALLAVILLGFAFRGIVGESLRGYSLHALAAATYVGDFVMGSGGGLGVLGHTWSLGVEEQFYLLWPLALILLLRFRRSLAGWTAVAVVVGFAVLAALSFVRSAYDMSDQAYYMPWARFSALLLGCLVAILLRGGIRLRMLERTSTAWLLAAAAVGLVGAAAVAGRYPGFAWEAPAIALVTAGLVWHVATTRSAFSAVVGWKPLAWLGRRSYGIYLYHVLALTLLLHRLPFRRVVDVLVVMLVAVVVAAISYQFLELPFLRLKKRLSGVPAPAAQPVPLAVAAAMPGSAPPASP